MFPLRDENPSGTVPLVTLLLIALNVAAFVHEISLGPALREWMTTWGVVPMRLALAVEQREDWLQPALTLVTSMFLHGGWLHLIGNLWYLWIFGDNVEDRMGHVRYLAFYLLGGIAAAVVHVALNPASRVPTVGASGAIAAVLGAYLVQFPRARVITLIPLVFYFQVVALPAVIVLGLWFLFQLASGWLAASGPAQGGIAFAAHVGGFVFGLIAFKLFGGRKPLPSERRSG